MIYVLQVLKGLKYIFHDAVRETDQIPCKSSGPLSTLFTYFNSLGPVIILRNGMWNEITSTECESRIIAQYTESRDCCGEEDGAFDGFPSSLPGSALLVSAFLDFWMSWRPSS